MVISATVASKEIFDVFGVGGLGGTFPGHPVCCVAALKVIEILEREKLLDRVVESGSMVKQRLQGMKEKYNIIGDVRVIGLSIGIELVKDRETKEPAPKEVREVLQNCHEHGLIIESTGEFKTVIRIIPPLQVKEGEIGKGLDILEVAIGKASNY